MKTKIFFSFFLALLVLCTSARAESTAELERVWGWNHGNFCGPGNHSWGKKPVDELDTICMHHDGCLKNNGAADGHAVCHCEKAFDAELDDFLASNSVFTSPILVGYARGAKVYVYGRIKSSCGGDSGDSNDE